MADDTMIKARQSLGGVALIVLLTVVVHIAALNGQEVLVATATDCYNSSA